MFVLNPSSAVDALSAAAAATVASHAAEYAHSMIAIASKSLPFDLTQGCLPPAAACDVAPATVVDGEDGGEMVSGNSDSDGDVDIDGDGDSDVDVSGDGVIFLDQQVDRKSLQQLQATLARYRPDYISQYDKMAAVDSATNYSSSRRSSSMNSTNRSSSSSVIGSASTAEQVALKLQQEQMELWGKRFGFVGDFLAVQCTPFTSRN
jgi:hypothetical protein